MQIKHQTSFKIYFNVIAECEETLSSFSSRSKLHFQCKVLGEPDWMFSLSPLIINKRNSGRNTGKRGSEDQIETEYDGDSEAEYSRDREDSDDSGLERSLEFENVEKYERRSIADLLLFLKNSLSKNNIKFSVFEGNIFLALTACDRKEGNGECKHKIFP